MYNCYLYVIKICFNIKKFILLEISVCAEETHENIKNCQVFKLNIEDLDPWFLKIWSMKGLIGHLFIYFSIYYIYIFIYTVIVNRK